MITVQETINYLKHVNFDTNDTCYLNPILVSDNVGLMTYNLTEEDLKKTGLDNYDSYLVPSIAICNNGMYMIYVPLDFINSFICKYKLFIVLHELGHLRNDAVGFTNECESLADRYAKDSLSLSKVEVCEYLDQLHSITTKALRKYEQMTEVDDEWRQCYKLLDEQITYRKEMA